MGGEFALFASLSELVQKSMSDIGATDVAPDGKIFFGQGQGMGLGLAGFITISSSSSFPLCWFFFCSKHCGKEMFLGMAVYISPTSTASTAKTDPVLLG